jgi:hypothetical protein
MTPVSEIPKLAGIYRLGAMISTSIADFGHDLPDTIPGADEKKGRWNTRRPFEFVVVLRLIRSRR